MKKMSFLKEEKFVFFGKIMIIMVLALNAWMTYRYYFNFLRSDDSSELVMSQFLASEGSILSRNWYYSTELEILNTQLIYSLLFHFFSDFKVVRIAGQIILSLIFLGCYYICLYCIDKEKAGNRFWKTAFLFLIPISSAWIYLILKAYYIPIIGVSFLVLGLACRVQNENLTKKSRITTTVAGCILAYISCLEGLRHIQLSYLPLVCSFLMIWWNGKEKDGWREDRIKIPKGMLESILWLVSALAGYLTNTGFLSKLYYYDTQQETMTPDTIPLQTFENVLNAFLNTTGYDGKSELVSYGGICNALAVIAAITVIYGIIRSMYRMKKESLQMQLVLGYVVCGFGISMFIYIMVDRVESRWVMAGMAPLLLLLLLWERFPKMKQAILLLCVYGTVFLLGSREYMDIRNNTQNEELREVYDFIMDSDYTAGYSTFRPGNLMTELTNGRFSTVIVKSDTENHKLVKRHWLTTVETPVIEGTFPVILEKERIEDEFQIPDNWTLVLDTENYLVYTCSDQAEFETYLSKKEL